MECVSRGSGENEREEAAQGERSSRHLFLSRFEATKSSRVPIWRSSLLVSSYSHPHISPPNSPELWGGPSCLAMAERAATSSTTEATGSRRRERGDERLRVAGARHRAAARAASGSRGGSARSRRWRRLRLHCFHRPSEAIDQRCEVENWRVTGREPTDASRAAFRVSESPFPSPLSPLPPPSPPRSDFQQLLFRIDLRNDGVRRRAARSSQAVPD